MSAAPSLKTSSTTSFLNVSLSLWKFRAKEDGKERPALTLEERKKRKSETPEEEAASSVF